MLLFNNDYKIAGTTDLIEIQDSIDINLYDFKTNKKLNNYNPWGKKLLYPVDHLYETDINFYSLQLSIYAILLEAFGFWVNNLTIYYIEPIKRELKIIPVSFMRKEGMNIINHYLKKIPEEESMNNLDHNFGF